MDLETFGRARTARTPATTLSSCASRVTKKAFFVPAPARTLIAASSAPAHCSDSVFFRGEVLELAIADLGGLAAAFGVLGDVFLQLFDLSAVGRDLPLEFDNQRSELGDLLLPLRDIAGLPSHGIFTPASVFVVGLFLLLSVQHNPILQLCDQLDHLRHWVARVEAGGKRPVRPHKFHAVGNP